MDMDMDTYPYPWSQSTLARVDCDLAVTKMALQPVLRTNLPEPALNPGVGPLSVLFPLPVPALIFDYP